ncbi:MAG TPA: iron ABC transporter permease, partial [Flavobacteriales bacterium]|nr:iron ABC transporter permease [Flavobacteriales bacterium]
VLCSGALAVSGLMMQSYFRNPLAGPSVMGVSSGASFGIALLLVCFPQFANGELGTRLTMVAFASMGAIAVLFLLSLIQFRLRNIETLLIVGLLITYFLGACETLLLSNTDVQNVKAFVYWGFGSFSKTDFNDIGAIAVMVGALICMAVFFSKALDAFQFSNQTVLNTGINKIASGRILIVLSGLLCAVVTGYCGPIAFIGLCVPHITRMYLHTSKHFYLLTGGLVMAANIGLICLTLSRLTFFGQNVPLNSVTSFLGAPFVIYILLRNRKNSSA